MRLTFTIALLLCFIAVLPCFADECKKCQDDTVKVQPVPTPVVDAANETALRLDKQKQKPNGKVKRFSLRLGKGCRCK